jgi:hypothetical protein
MSSSLITFEDSNGVEVETLSGGVSYTTNVIASNPPNKTILLVMNNGSVRILSNNESGFVARKTTIVADIKYFETYIFEVGTDFKDGLDLEFVQIMLSEDGEKYELVELENCAIKSTGFQFLGKSIILKKTSTCVEVGSSNITEKDTIMRIYYTLDNVNTNPQMNDILSLSWDDTKFNEVVIEQCDHQSDTITTKSYGVYKGEHVANA